jgi:antitoxin component YwqK of YwqJK toxin-antitoxin module
MKITLLTILLFFITLSCNKKSNNEQIKQSKNEKIVYYLDGRIKSILRYNSKIMEGESLWFYSNGNLEQKVPFIKGKANGNAFYFYESGAIKSHRHYTNDSLNGYVTDYKDDSIGRIKTVVLYDNGKVIDIRRAETEGSSK